MSDLDPDFAILHTDGEGFQVDAGGRAFRLAGAVVERGIVLGAFHGAIHDKSIAKMHLLMAADPVHGVKAVILGPDDDEGLRSVVKADQVVGVDVVGGAGPDVKEPELDEKVKANFAEYRKQLEG